MPRIGTLIRRRRLALGLSQREVANRTRGRVTFAALSFIESGRTKGPGLDVCLALAAALEVRLGTLIAPLEKRKGTRRRRGAQKRKRPVQ